MLFLISADIIQMDNQYSFIKKDNLFKSAFTPLGLSLATHEKIEKKQHIVLGQKIKVEGINQTIKIQEQEQQNNIEQKKCKKKLVEWTSQQDNILFDRYIHKGPKWVQIAQIFPSKNDNDVKNRFYCCLKKVLKRINSIQKAEKLKPKKPLGLDSLLTVLEIGKWNQNTTDKRFLQINKNMNSIIQARNSIIEVAVKPQSENQKQQLISLVEQLLNLKHCLKFINVKRVKKCVGKCSANLSNFEQNQSNEERQEENENEELKKKTEKFNNEDTSEDDQLYDIEKIYCNFYSKTKQVSISLIESCKDILCPTLVTRQQSQQHLIFLC